MVGVPGRSQACLSCKRRKKQCDLEKPACRRCVKSSQICRWEERNSIFVNVFTSSDKPVYNKSLRASGPSSIGNDGDDDNPHSRNRDSPRRRDAMIRFVNDDWTQHLVQKHTISKLISPEGVVQSGILGLFPWIMEPLEGGNDTNIWTPAHACSLIWMGRREGSTELVKSSFKHYTTGLRAAQSALWDGKGNMHAFSWHIEGCLRLLKLRGPAAHREGPAHMAFLMLRLHGILRDVFCGVESFLAEPDWMTVPWELDAKTTFHQLLDVLCLVPGLAARCKRVHTIQGDERFAAYASVMDECVNYERAVERHFADMEAEYGAPLFVRTPKPRCDPNTPRASSMTSNGTGQPQLTERLTLNNIYVARNLAIYWAIRAILVPAYEGLYTLIRQGLPSLTPPLPARINPSYAFVDVIKDGCQCVRYYLANCGTEVQDMMPIAGSLNLLLLSMRELPAEFEEELPWAECARERFGQMGLSFMFFMGAQRDQHPHSEHSKYLQWVRDQGGINGPTLSFS